MNKATKIPQSLNVISIIFVPVSMIALLLLLWLSSALFSVDIKPSVYLFSEWSLLLVFLIIHYCNLFLSARLPGASVFNPFGTIEIHLDNTAGWDAKLFLYYAAATIIRGYLLNKNVQFVSHHISEIILMHLVPEEALIFENPNFFDRLSMRMSDSKHGNSNEPARRPIIKGMIIVNRLTPRNIQSLERWAQRAQIRAKMITQQQRLKDIFKEALKMTKIPMYVFLCFITGAIIVNVLINNMILPIRVLVIYISLIPAGWPVIYVSILLIKGLDAIMKLIRNRIRSGGGITNV